MNELVRMARMEPFERSLHWTRFSDAEKFELLNDALDRLEDWEAFAVTVVAWAQHPVVGRRAEELLRHARHALDVLAVHSEPAGLDDQGEAPEVDDEAFPHGNLG